MISNKIMKFKKEILIVIITLVVASGIFFIISNINKASYKSDVVNVKNEEVTYVGSKNSNKYHRSSCKWASNIKKSNKITFTSEEKAIRKGYTACKTCKP